MSYVFLSVQMDLQLELLLTTIYVYLLSLKS